MASWRVAAAVAALISSSAIIPSTPARAAESPIRAMWVVRTSLESPASVHRVVETAMRANVNTLFVQVRGRGDAWYETPLEPRAEGLAGQPASFDPLAQILVEAHAHHIAVHAWMNTFLAWSGTHAPRSPEHLFNRHRNWFATDASGRVTAVPTNRREGAFLQPSSPGVRSHLEAVYAWVASHYAVDGIHFDYCRYEDSAEDFSPEAVHRFDEELLPRLTPAQRSTLQRRLQTERLAAVHAYPEMYRAWRVRQLTDCVTGICAAIRAARPDMCISAAVFPNAADALRDKGQDWAGWLRSRLLDGVALMAYSPSTQTVISQTRAAVAASGGTGWIVTGIGAWRLPEPDVERKIAGALGAGASGVSLFSYDSVSREPGYLGELTRGEFASRSLPPDFRRRAAAQSGATGH